MSYLAFLLLTLTQGPSTHPPGNLIILEKSAATARLVDAAHGKSMASIKVGDGPHEVAISPDFHTAVVANYGGKNPGRSLTLIHLNEMGKPKTRHIDLGQAMRPHGLAFGPSNRFLWVTAEVTGELWRIDLKDGKVIKKIDVGKGSGHMVAAMDDKHVFVSHISAGCITPVTQQEDGSWKAGERIPTGAGAEGIWVQPGTDLIWVTNRAADSVSIVDASEGKEIAELPCAGFPIRVMFSADGSVAAVSCADANVIALFDTTTKEQIARIPIGFSSKDDSDTRLFKDQFGESAVPIGMVFGGHGNHLYVSCAGADRIADIDIRLQRVVQVFKTGKEPDGIGWYPAAPPQTTEVGY
ncbi:MAG: YncE family protein [Planctomycetota bacterium]